jgi:hypothetical protein
MVRKEGEPVFGRIAAQHEKESAHLMLGYLFSAGGLTECFQTPASAPCLLTGRASFASLHMLHGNLLAYCTAALRILRRSPRAS